jgi:zona occludens toxin
MASLFTGAPRTGKTAAAVSLVCDLLKADPDRPLFVIEIPEEGVAPLGLKLPHTLLGPGDAEQWPTLVPDGAILFVTEAQRIWPNRPASRPPPAHVEALGQHGHRDIDVVLETQDGKLLDDRVRLRVRRHVHLVDRGLLGRRWLEWPQYADAGKRSSPDVNSKYSLPKKVFSLYTSATAHRKLKRRVPWQLWVFLGGIVALLLLIAYVVWSVSAKVSAPGAVPNSPGASGAPSSIAAGRALSSPTSGAELVLSFVPRVSHLPNSAPAYDELRRVAWAPRVQGGYCLPSGCRCYLQQGLPAPISEAACREHVSNPQFDPYHAPEAPKALAPTPKALTPPDVAAPFSAVGASLGL